MRLRAGNYDAVVTRLMPNNVHAPMDGFRQFGRTSPGWAMNERRDSKLCANAGNYIHLRAGSAAGRYQRLRPLGKLPAGPSLSARCAGYGEQVIPFQPDAAKPLNRSNIPFSGVGFITKRQQAAYSMVLGTGTSKPKCFITRRL